VPVGAVGTRPDRRQIGGPDIGVRCTPRRPQNTHSAIASRHSEKPMSTSSNGWKKMRPCPKKGGGPSSAG